MQSGIKYRKSQGQEADREYFASRVAYMERKAARQEQHALAVYGILQGQTEHTTTSSPRTCYLGPTTVVISVFSIRDTANERNETDIRGGVFPRRSTVLAATLLILAQESLRSRQRWFGILTTCGLTLECVLAHLNVGEGVTRGGEAEAARCHHQATSV